MPCAWKAFDEFVGRRDYGDGTHSIKDVARKLKAKATLMVAETFRHMTAQMLLVGKPEQARSCAALAEEYARTAIERGHSLLLSGRRLKPDIAKYWMWDVVYRSRWLLDGREDALLMERMLWHAKAAVEEESKNSRRSANKRSAEAGLAVVAAQVGDFDLAKQYTPVVRKSIDWSGGCTEEMCDRLFARVVRFLSDPRGHETERASIVRCYSDLLNRLRSGAMDLHRGHYDLAIGTAYYGMKYFERIREGAPFTYEEVVRSIRYAPGSRRQSTD